MDKKITSVLPVLRGLIGGALDIGALIVGFFPQVSMRIQQLWGRYLLSTLAYVF